MSKNNFSRALVCVTLHDQREKRRKRGREEDSVGGSAVRIAVHETARHRDNGSVHYTNPSHLDSAESGCYE